MIELKNAKLRQEYMLRLARLKKAKPQKLTVWNYTKYQIEKQHEGRKNKILMKHADKDKRLGNIF